MPISPLERDRQNAEALKASRLRERRRRHAMLADMLANPPPKSPELLRMEHALTVLARIVVGDNARDAEVIAPIYEKLEKELEEWNDDIRVRAKKRLAERFPGLTPAKRRKAWTRTGEKPVVYFIRSGEYIKIGKSTHWRDRLAAIQTGSPHPVIPLLIIPARRKTERQLHVRFKVHHVQGEWFHPSPEIMAYIEARKADNLLVEAA